MKGIFMIFSRKKLGVYVHPVHPPPPFPTEPGNFRSTQIHFPCQFLASLYYKLQIQYKKEWKILFPRIYGIISSL